MAAKINDALTGSDIPYFPPPDVRNPILVALELSALAELLGGPFAPRPANTTHRIFLL
jgi:hypothetical protein